jgi:tRNA-dihydrouridine synthase 3
MGSQHTTKQGANVSKETVIEPPLTVNGLPRDVQEQLRRNKYPFVCPRHRDAAKAKPNSNGEPKDAAPAPPDFAPLPAKEVKLIDFSNKVYVAPLTTVGNLPFRRVMKKFGGTCDGATFKMRLPTLLASPHAPRARCFFLKI